jgi:uncharacterized protein
MAITRLTALTTAVMIGAVPLAAASSPPATAVVSPGARTGWDGIVREAVRIPMDGDWVARGELTYPRGVKGKLPVVVLLHGSGPQDMNQTVKGNGSTFVPLAQAANRKGFAVLRFNKRGVLGVGPVVSDDDALRYPPKPYEQVLRDAATAVRFAASRSRVDPRRVFLLGHSEGTQVAGNLAANPAAYGMVRPAGVVAMGVVGGTARDVFYYQAIGRTLSQLHDEADFDGDGSLSATELADAPLDGVSSEMDANHDGKLSIDGEIRPALEAATRIDRFPDMPGLPKGLADYVQDIGRFPVPARELPRFHGPVLLLNGETDIQTRVRGAIVADKALAASGNRDHTLIVYPGMSHFMRVTPQYSPVDGGPDRVVVDDVSAWLAAR